MNLKLAKYGKRMTALTGVRAIMKDIQQTLGTVEAKEFINLSPGNPVILPEVNQLWERTTKDLLASEEFKPVVGRYGSSSGYEPLIQAIKDDYNKRFGLSLTEKNILITPGSQSLFFYGANSFGGYDDNNKTRKVVLPCVPEYTGYGGVSLSPEVVQSYRPNIEIFEETNEFKYRPDLESIELDEDSGCLIFSRPCNPTGNVLTDNETLSLVEKAKNADIPVFIDSAYSYPYPNLCYTETKPVFDNNVVHCVTLSKAGLAGERVGFAIGSEEIISILESFQTNACIHSSRYGQAIAARAIKSGELYNVCKDHVHTFYKKRFNIIRESLFEYLGQKVEWYTHKAEGSIFCWLWLKGIGVRDWDLYQKLKKEQKLLIVPGSTFFPGLKEDQDNPWEHRYECFRVSLTATEEDIREGVRRLARGVVGVS